MSNFWNKAKEKVKEIAKAIKDGIVSLAKKAKKALEGLIDWCDQRPIFTMTVAMVGMVFGCLKLAASLPDEEPKPEPSREEKINKYIDAELWKARNSDDSVNHMANVRNAMLTLSAMKRMEATESSSDILEPTIDPMSV